MAPRSLSSCLAEALREGAASSCSPPLGRLARRSLNTGFAAGAAGELDELHKLHEELESLPPMTQREESALQAEAAKNGAPPRIVGDHFKFNRDKLKAAAKECFEAALTAKKAIKDEILEGHEAVSLNKEQSECLASTADMIKDMNLSFSGNLGHRFLDAAKAADESCASLSASLNSHPDRAFEVAAHSGMCMAATGKALAAIYPDGGVVTSSMPVSLPGAALLLDRELLRFQRPTAGQAECSARRRSSGLFLDTAPRCAARGARPQSLLLGRSTSKVCEVF
eukprot:TRINITY_DN22848_c0_g1_i2.p1 TRINITY_DN22848_c0_g1~~TRINITY_DN22848_c0_g1_i2.p1  ORF type:complete len:305 (-),score=59.13 TRINITY_DN22848_c0_g1_i2:385-1230(-)